jgi:hypothetical protein
MTMASSSASRESAWEQLAEAINAAVYNSQEAPTKQVSFAMQTTDVQGTLMENVGEHASRGNPKTF